MRRLPLVLVLTAAALALTAGCDAPTRPERASPIEAISLEGTVAADGTVRVVQDVRFTGARGGSITVAAPLLGSLEDLTVDGNERTGGGASTTLGARAPSASIGYVLQGAAERYADVAEVSIAVWARQSEGAATDAPVPVRGTLHLPAAATTVHWHGASSGGARLDGDTVRLDGAVAVEQASTLVLTVPAAALGDLAVLRDEPRADYLAERQVSLDAADGRVGAAVRREARHQDLLAQTYWGLVGVEVGIPLLVVAVRLARTGRRRRAAEAGIPHTSSDPPGDESAALVALLQDEGHDIGRAAVAATVLDLVHRKVLDLQGITSERWVLRLDGADRLAVRPGEAAVIAALREHVEPDGNVTGPPLPIDPDGPWWRALRADVVAQARAAGLLARRYPSGLFLTSVVALTLTTAPLWFRTPAAAAGGLVVAIVFVALPLAGGYVLTPAGLRRRAAWRSFGRYIHEQGNLNDVPPTGIAIWGPYLSQGAALGEAPHAVEGLAPARTPRTRGRGTSTPVAALLVGAALTAALVGGGLRPDRAAADVGPIPECEVGSRSDFRTAHPDLDAIQDDLTGIDLSCQDLSGIDFGQATLTGAVLAKAKVDDVDLIQAQLEGADLRGIHGAGARFDQARMAGARLDGADLGKADFGQTDLTNAVLDGAVLKAASFTQATVDGASFAKVDLSGTKLSGLELDGVDLRDATFHGSDLTFASFTRSDLRGADLGDTTMFSADFTKADARGADFSGAKLSSSTFDGADLTGASFRSADLGGSTAVDAMFRDVDLTDARGTSALHGADTTGATGLPESHPLPWLLGIGAVLLVAILAAVAVRRSRGIAADA